MPSFGSGSNLFYVFVVQSIYVAKQVPEQKFCASPSYFTTDGDRVRLSWHLALFGTHEKDHEFFTVAITVFVVVGCPFGREVWHVLQDILLNHGQRFAVICIP